MRDVVARDPDNGGWQNDLSLTLSRVGDARRTAGDQTGALDAYEEGLAMMRELVARDSGNAIWQRGLGFRLVKIGEARLQHGDRVLPRSPPMRRVR